jgi:hypothetical protein
VRVIFALRVAEAGCTAHEIAAITGHASLREIERYTKAADQRRLAKAAMGKAKPEHRVSNLPRRLTNRENKAAK